jgi:hypothetical protein
MSPAFQDEVSNFTKRLIETTVHTVLEKLAESNPSDGQIFDTKQLANLLSVSPSFINRLRVKG